MHLLLVLCCLISACLVSAETAVGEGVAVGRDGVKLSGFGNVDVERTIEHWIQREKADVTTRLNLQIELLTDACGLDQADVKKMQLAAQGVTARRIASGREQVRQFLYDSELVPADADAPDDAPPRRHEDVWRPYAAGNLGNGIVEFKGQFSKPLLAHPLWVGVMRTSLSGQQMEKYGQFQRNRNKSLLSTAILVSIGELDAELLLSEQQKQDVHADAMKQLSRQVTSDGPASLREAGVISGRFFKDRDAFREFLRPTQIERLTFQQGNPIGTNVGWGSPQR